MSRKFPEREREVAERKFFADGKRILCVWRQLNGEKKVIYEGASRELPDGFLIEGVTEEGDDGVLQAFDLYDAQKDKALREMRPVILTPRNGRGKRRMS